jgi:hypothetical protein
VTLPHERMRCLLWGSDLLREIESGQGFSTSHRARANELLANYPSGAELRRLVHDKAVAMSDAHANAIEAARELFEAVQRAGISDEKVRRSVLFTLRHFPIKGLAPTWITGFFMGIDDWLAEEAPTAPNS